MEELRNFVWLVAGNGWEERRFFFFVCLLVFLFFQLLFIVWVCSVMWSFLKLRLEFFLQCSPTGNSVIRGIFETLIFCFLWPTKPLIRVSELSLATEKVWERKESYFYFYF